MTHLISVLRATVGYFVALILSPFDERIATFDERIRTPRNGSFEIVDGGVARRRGKEIEKLRCLSPDGTGRVFDLAADPAGPVFVAAENGVFLASTESPLLDRLDLGVGAPRGTPRAVHVDDERRLWLLTDREFGPVDTAYLFGAVALTTATAGVGEFRRFMSREPGRFVIATDRSPVEYRVPGVAGRPDPPRLEPRDSPRGESLTRTYPADVAFEVANFDDAALDYYYHLDDHQTPRRMIDKVVAIDSPAPGRRSITVYAVDRNLLRSTPTKIEFEIEMPFYWRRSFVFTAILAGFAGLTATLLVSARRRGGGAVRYGKCVIGTCIVVALLLQSIAGAFGHSRGWPFVGYSMYTSVYAKNSEVHRVLLRGIGGDGRFTYVDPRRFGTAIDSDWQIMRPFIHGDTDARRGIVDGYRRHNPNVDLRGLQVVARRTRLTDSGPESVASLVLAHFEETPR